MTATISYDDQTAALLEAIVSHGEEHGASLCKSLHESALPLLHWLDYLRSYELTGVADTLLKGVHGAILEVAGCISLGLVRPAIFSLRAQVDMLLAWLYFRNHGVEWDHITETGKDFMLKSDLLKFLGNYFPHTVQPYASGDGRTGRGPL